MDLAFSQCEVNLLERANAGEKGEELYSTEPDCEKLCVEASCARISKSKDNERIVFV